MPEVQLIQTKDGSSSLLLPELNETYHSTHGAMTESQYVFIKQGLETWCELNPKKSEINILEVGFGTGLNVWLTAKHSRNSAFHVRCTSIEKFPLEKKVIDQLNYADDESDRDKNLFSDIHSSEWNSLCPITNNFTLTKIEKDIFEYELGIQCFDIIYFDAFAPSRQPEMWSRALLTKIYESTALGGIFVTYCAQGQFKRDLKACGYQVEELPGPPGKKEMTRGKRREV